jgi:MFS family permease
MMSTCIIAAQAVMLPFALLVGYKADTWGRKPLFLAGFASCQSVRCSIPFPTIASG